MKKILFILSILFSINSFSQGNITGNRVQANLNLLPPLDTVAAPYRVGEVRTKVSGGDTLFFQCISLSAPRKWVSTKMSVVPISIQKVGDSTIFWINGVRFATKDSLGSSSGTLPTKAAGYLLSGTGSAGYDTIGVYWDSVNNRIGINVTSPEQALDILGGLKLKPTSGNTVIYVWSSASVAPIGTIGATASDFIIAGNIVRIIHSGGTSSYFGSAGLGISTTQSTSTRTNIAASTSAISHMRLNAGANVSAPTDGDAWYDGTHYYFRKGSSTIDLLHPEGRGLYAANGDGILTTFTVTHGFTGTPTNVQVTPAGVDSAVPFFVSNITGTTFDVTFTTPPIVGTNNVTFYWTAK